MKRSRFYKSPKEYLIIAGLGVLMFWLVFAVIDIFKKEEIARNTAYEAQDELTALSSRKETLERDIAELETKRGQEAVIRENFGVALPGEEVIIVVPEQEDSAGNKLPWWRKLFGWFGL